MDYKELIELLRYEGYDVSRNEAANALVGACFAIANWVQFGKMAGINV